MIKSYSNRAFLGD